MRRPAAFEHAQAGQASVELVVAVPIILLIGAIGWQLALAGHAAWMSAHAARAAARADVVGRDPRTAAHSALPATLRRGLEVRRLPSGGVRVRVRVPTVLPASRGGPKVAASASLGKWER